MDEVLSNGFTPLGHQVSAIQQLQEGKRAIFLPYGLGKSFVSAYVVRDALYSGTILILCEKRNTHTWVTALDAIFNQPLVYIVDGHVKLWRRVCDEDLRDTQNATMRVIILSYSIMGNHIDELIIRLSQQNVNAIIADESTNFKNPKAALTKACLKLGSAFYDVPKYILSGGPHPEGNYEVWSQLEFTGRNPFESTYYKFLTKWFIHPRFCKPVVKLGLEDEFRKRLEWAGIWIGEDDVLRIKKELGIPEEVYVIRQFPLSEEQTNLLAHLYRYWELPCEAPDDANTDINAKEEYGYALTVNTKAQQICSGFYYTQTGDTVFLKTNPKLTWLTGLLRELFEEDPQRKVVVWYAFKEERDMILNSLPPQWGAVAGPDTEKLKQFQDDPNCRVIVTPEQICKGFNELIVADVDIFYSSTFSQEMRNQAEGRLPRIGSKFKYVRHIDLCSSDGRDYEVVTELQCKNLTKARLNTIVTKYMKGFFDDGETTAADW